MPDKVAIILPVYIKDTIDYFKKSIGSLEKQIYQDFKVIIILDGPVSNEILDFVNRLDAGKYEILTNETNLGLPASLNKAIKHCISNDFEFIARMDADDLCHEERIRQQVQFLKDHQDVQVVGTEAFIIDDSDKIIGIKKVTQELSYKILRKVSDIIHPSVMFRKSFFEDVGYYDEQLLQSQDYDLWFRAVKKSVKIKSIDQCFYYLRYDRQLVQRRKRAQRFVLKIKRRYLYPWEYFYLLPQLFIISSPDFVLKLILFRKIRNAKTDYLKKV